VQKEDYYTSPTWYYSYKQQLSVSQS